jgi:hypothetical protein
MGPGYVPQWNSLCCRLGPVWAESSWCEICSWGVGCSLIEAGLSSHQAEPLEDDKV